MTFGVNNSGITQPEGNFWVKEVKNISIYYESREF